MTLEDIFSFENLYESYKNCRKGKQHKGEVIRFETNLAFNISKIQEEIRSKKYKLGNYKTFYIYEPKERLIEALPFKDRIVVRCFCEMCLKPKIEKKLIYDNAACRKEKGTFFAIKRLHLFLRREYKNTRNNDIYFLKCDIKKYFPNIHHDILLDLLKEIDFSEDKFWFIEKLIKEQPDKASQGLPLGNQSSQWFALLYLNKIDHFIKEQLGIKFYVRYMDDMILIHKEKEVLKKCKIEIEKRCNVFLNLELNAKTQIGQVKNGIDFLGYRHILKENGRIIMKLRASSKRRMINHIKTIKKLQQKNVIDENYVKTRKSAFLNHIRKTKENKKWKEEIFSK